MSIDRADPPVKQSRKQQGAHTRLAIITAAAELYADHGFRGTGLMAIGRHAGVSHATVLYHFGTSRDLLLEVLRHRDRQFREFASSTFAGGGLDALARVPLLATFNAVNPLTTRLLTVMQMEGLSPDSDVHNYFVLRRRRLRDLIVEGVNRAKVAGHIKVEVDALDVAEMVLAMLTGTTVQQLLDPDSNAERSLSTFMTLLLDGLVTAAGRRRLAVSR